MVPTIRTTNSKAEMIVNAVRSMTKSNHPWFETMDHFKPSQLAAYGEWDKNPAAH